MVSLNYPDISDNLLKLNLPPTVNTPENENEPPVFKSYISWLNGNSEPVIESAINDILLDQKVYKTFLILTMKGMKPEVIKNLYLYTHGGFLSEEVALAGAQLFFNDEGMTRQDWGEFADDCIKHNLILGKSVYEYLNKSLLKTQTELGVIADVDFKNLLKLIMGSAFVNLQQTLTEKRDLDTIEMLRLAIRAGELYTKLDSNQENPLTTLTLDLQEVKKEVPKYKDAKELFGPLA